MPRARVAVALLLGAVAFATASPAYGQTIAQAEPREEPGDQIVLSGDVEVRRGTDVGQVVVFHGSVDVAGVVHGDVVVIDGRIDVTGQVSGSVVSINGPVTIGANAQILGDVLARDRLRIADGAVIGGQVREGTAFTFRSPIDLLGPFAAWLAVVVSTLALGAVLVLVAPRGADAVAVAATRSPWASGGIGIALVIGLPVLGVLALVSLVGLPFGLGLLLSLALVYSIGYTWSAFAVGRVLWRPPRSRWLALLIGWAIVAALTAVPFAGPVVWFIGAVYGVGAMTVAGWRARGAGGRHRPGGKMPPEPERVVDLTAGTVPQPMITERAMREEGTGI